MARKYQSQKRPRPCDPCRSRKLKCEIEGAPPCRRCEQESLSCSFAGKPRKRAFAESSQDETAALEDSYIQRPQPGRGRDRDKPASTLAETEAQTSITPTNSNTAQTAQPERYNIHSSDSYMNTMPGPFLLDYYSDRMPTQLSQSLDRIEDCTSALLGSSSESDPWLLRHCRFDEFGIQSLGELRFRNVGGVPISGKIPAHFLVSPDTLSESTIADTEISNSNMLRNKLDGLVSPSHGQRLIRLYHKYIFDVLPVISRTDFKLGSLGSLPPPDVIADTSVHLLAAIYASALSFFMYDDHLAGQFAYEAPPTTEVWRIAYEDIQASIHRPRLTVIQSMLLYLHKTTQDQHRFASADTAFVWSFMGSIVGLAHNLGLQLDCRLFAIPQKDKRIRRRLWWATFIEDKFLSLLAGKPPYIRQNEWDATELDESDFHMDITISPNDFGSAFRHLSRLAVIAESVQESLYSLKRCQKLAEDFTSSYHAAKPLFDALNGWRAAVPAMKVFHRNAEESIQDPSCYPVSVHFAYLTLLVYVWRALLRSPVRSLPPPHVIDMDAPILTSQPSPAPPFLFDNLDWDFPDVPDMNLPDGDAHLSDDTVDKTAAIKELHHSAQNYAGNLVGFTRSLSSTEFGEFWHSWSRLSFAVVSNFLVLLQVQAPSTEDAIKASKLLIEWKKVVCDQSRVSPLLSFAFTRLSAIFKNGIADTFYLPAHVQQALQSAPRLPLVS